MRAGRMDRRITIERMTTSADSMGFPSPTWSTHKTIWAEVVWMGGKEMLQTSREVTKETALFRVWYVDVTTHDRINYDSKTWDILTIKEIGRKEGLEITAEQRS